MYIVSIVISTCSLTIIWEPLSKQVNEYDHLILAIFYPPLK